jgi:ribosomal-protein-alanine N-acetyltransferase
MTISAQPQLVTQRLVLRAFQMADAEAVQQLAGDRIIASTTCSIPHPYPAGAAEQWISGQPAAYAEGIGVTFAITLRKSGELVGAMGFNVNQKNDWAEIGYWIGHPHWGRGYATEALRALIPWTFETMPLNRLQACHFTRNPASGRVMIKAGMRPEGILRQRVKKWGVFEDIAIYSILRPELSGLS